MHRSENLSIANLPKWLLLLLIFSLAATQPAIGLIGFAAVPTDFLYLACLLAWLVALTTGRAQFVGHRAYWLLVLYLGTLIVSAMASESPADSGPKLLTQIYLLSLPMLVVNLLRTFEDLRLAVLWWLAGTAVLAAVGAASVGAFLIDPSLGLFDFARSHFGTLPPGPYLRLRLTFANANMACNYLTVSMMCLLVARQMDWIGHRPFLILLAGIVLSALLTISPGLGGIALAASLWTWSLHRHGSRITANGFLFAGLVVALVFVVAMAFTPIAHPTAPFLLHVPPLDLVLAPSGRLMIWRDAAMNFLADPWLGRGIGSDAVNVRYPAPSGGMLVNSDAHNSFLSIAVQAGAVGLAALIAIPAYVLRRWLVPIKANPDAVGIGLAIAFTVAFVYEGLGGSFEDARHLWVLFGLLLVADRTSRLPA